MDTKGVQKVTSSMVKKFVGRCKMRITNTINAFTLRVAIKNHFLINNVIFIKQKMTHLLKYVMPEV